MKRLILLAWCVLVTHRRQYHEPFWTKLKLILHEIHHPRSFRTYRRPLTAEGAGGLVEDKPTYPASLDELLKEGFQVGTVASIARGCHEMRARDNRLFAGGEA